MRTKEEILTDCNHDILDEQYKTNAHLWVELRKIEVLIDIRDILAADRQTSMAISQAMKKRKQ